MTSTAPLPDLDALAKQLSAGVFSQWMRRAQRVALIEWRDRTQPPGLMARFTPQGTDYYDFPARNYDKHRRLKRYYQHTGAMREMMEKRKPRSNRDKDEAVTTLAYGGGALNFLTKVGGIESMQTVSERVAVSVGAHTRKRKGENIQVKASTQTRTVRSLKVTRRASSYAADFGRFVRDRPWIADRTAEVFREIVRKALIGKNGKLRSKAFARLSGQGDTA